MIDMRKYPMNLPWWPVIIVGLVLASGAPQAGACLYDKCFNTAYGAFTDDSISAMMEAHGYSFDALEGDVVLIRAARGEGTLDPVASLFSPRGNLVGRAGIPSTGYADLTVRANSGDGNYVAVINDFMGNGRGRYYMSFQCANRPVNPRKLEFHGVIRDSIVRKTEMIPYQFSALAGDIVTVQMIGINGDIEPRLQLFGPDGRLYGEAMNETYADVSNRILDVGGKYTVIVTDFAGDESGEFFLILSRSPTNADDGTTGLPAEFALYPNYPNPFNPQTIIEFNLPRYSVVSLDVFNILGERIRTLVSDLLPPGRHTVTWDGTTSSGEQAASGIYFYRLSAGDFIQSRKMLLLK